MSRKEITLKDVAIFLHKHMAECDGFRLMIEKWKAGYKNKENSIGDCVEKISQNVN